MIARAEMEHGLPVLIRPEPLPQALVDGIAQVARDFGLPADWMNTAVAEQWRYGLPPTMADGIEWHAYGGLHVGIAGRQALIALKLFAAVDQGPRSVHMQDLLRFRATEDELANAAAWVGQQDASAQFAADLEETLAYVRTHGR